MIEGIFKAMVVSVNWVTALLWFAEEFHRESHQILFNSKIVEVSLKKRIRGLNSESVMRPQTFIVLAK